MRAGLGAARGWGGGAVGRVLKPMVWTEGKGAAILDHSIFLFNDNNVSRKTLR